MKKRILLVSCNNLKDGGVQRIIMSIVKQLSAFYIFDIFNLTESPGVFDDSFLKFGGKIYRSNIIEHRNLFDKISKIVFYKKWYKKALSNILKANNYLAVHCFNETESGYVLCLAKKNNIPIRISHSNVFQTPKSIIRKTLLRHNRRLLIKNSTHLIGCSEDSCISLFGEKSNYSVINDPYDDANIRFSSDTPKNLVLLQIGRFDDNKNQRFSLLVLKEILQRIGNAKLYFLGFDDSSSVRSFAVEMDIHNNIYFYDRATDKMALFKASSYLIFPSKREGFGIVAIEAQAAGLHCFASDTIPTSTQCGGIEYLSIESGPKHWSDVICNYYQRQNGKKDRFDCSKFSENQFVQEIKSIYLYNK